MMQQEFKMNNEKKVYRKPLMEVVDMDSQSELLCASNCDDVVDTEYVDE